MTSDKRYFARRASEEAMRAATAGNLEARRWHQELADKFARVAEELGDVGSHTMARHLPTRSREHHTASR